MVAIEHWFHTSLPLLKSHALTLREVAGTKKSPEWILGSHYFFSDKSEISASKFWPSKRPNVHCRWENGKREWQNKNHLIATRNAYTQEKMMMVSCQSRIQRVTRALRTTLCIRKIAGFFISFFPTRDSLFSHLQFANWKKWCFTSATSRLVIPRNFQISQRAHNRPWEERWRLLHLPILLRENFHNACKNLGFLCSLWLLKVLIVMAKLYSCHFLVCLFPTRRIANVWMKNVNVLLQKGDLKESKCSISKPMDFQAHNDRLAWAQAHVGSQACVAKRGHLFTRLLPAGSLWSSSLASVTQRRACSQAQWLTWANFCEMWNYSLHTKKIKGGKVAICNDQAYKSEVNFINIR